jgi:hypothetical protein
MAVKKIQMRPPDNDYADVLHPETDTTMVLLPDGSVLQDQLVAPLASGSATALVIDMPGITSYTHLKLFQFIASANNNEAATTLKIGTLPARPIYLEGTVNTAPKLIAGRLYTVWADNTKNCFFLKASGSGNAVAADLLVGKTATTDNGPITGTMPNQGAKIITPSTVNQVIAEGYHNGLGYVKGDSNLTPANIKKGVTIFGKTGVLQPSLLGANPANVIHINKTHTFTTINSSETMDITTIPSGWQYIMFISDRYDGDYTYRYNIPPQSRFEFDSNVSGVYTKCVRLDLRNTQTNAVFSITELTTVTKYTLFEDIENFGFFRVSDTQVYFTKLCRRRAGSEDLSYDFYTHWQLKNIPATEMKLQSYVYNNQRADTTFTATNKLKGKLIYG